MYEYDEKNGLVWDVSHEHFGVVEKCPICSELVGTGIAYKADEPIYECAGEYARRALAEHLLYEHGVE